MPYSSRYSKVFSHILPILAKGECSIKASALFIQIIACSNTYPNALDAKGICGSSKYNKPVYMITITGKAISKLLTKK